MGWTKTLSHARDIIEKYAKMCTRGTSTLNTKWCILIGKKSEKTQHQQNHYK